MKYKIVIVLMMCGIGLSAQWIDPWQIRPAPDSNMIIGAKGVYNEADWVYVDSLGLGAVDSIFLRNDTIFLKNGSGFVKIPKIKVGQTVTVQTLITAGDTIYAGVNTNSLDSTHIKAGSVARNDLSIPVVSSVTASSPLFSSAGLNPNITIQNASGSQSGAITSTDWNSFNTKVGGTGVATRVAFWNSANTLSSNTNLYWDNTTARLGLGTTTPSDKLTLSGFIGEDFIGLNNVLSANNRTFKLIAGIPGSTYNGFSIYDNYALASRLYINNSGNIGIGNQEDNYKLSVEGTMQVKNRTGTSVNGAAFNGLGQLVEMTGLPPLGSGATNKVAYWSSGTNLTFQNWYHIDPSNRRIGMGTSTPTDGLTISGFAGTDFIALNNVLSTNNRTFKLIAGDAFGSRNGFSIYDSDANSTRLNISNSGLITLSNLGGSGTRMVVANGSGDLSTQDILDNLSNNEGLMTLTTNTINTNYTFTSNTTGTTPLVLNASTGITMPRSGNQISFGLTNTGVSVGTYTNTNITVDAQGRITSASNGTAGSIDTLGISGGRLIARSSLGINLGALGVGLFGNTQIGISNASNAFNFSINSGSITPLLLDRAYLTSEVDGITNNEGLMSLTGASSPYTYNSNTTLSTPLIIAAGTNVTIGRSTNTLTINATEVDGSVTNEIQNLGHSVSGTDRIVTISGGIGTTINVADNDNNSTNEGLMSLTGASSPYTYSSNTSGSNNLILASGANTTITRSGNTLTFASTGGGGSGTVTSITANSPLTGGTITTSGSIGIQTASGSQAGAISSTDWTKFNNKFNLPSLTSGSVLFSNGTTIAEDNTNFLWNNSTKRLRLGATAATDRLTISGYNGEDFIGLNNVLSTNNRTFKIIAGINGGTRDGLSIFDSHVSATRFYISNSGNVGIGNNDDTYKLSVEGNFQVKTRTGTSVNGAAFNGLGQLVEMSGLPPLGSGATNKVAYWSSGTNLTFQNWYHIDPSNRRIGMGTSTPTDGLTISGFAGTDFIALNNTLSTNNRTFKLIAGDAFGSRNGFSIYDSDANSTRFNISNAGLITLSNLAGSGNRMVIANSNGDLSTQAIPVDTDVSIYNSNGSIPSSTTRTVTIGNGSTLNLGTSAANAGALNLQNNTGFGSSLTYGTNNGIVSVNNTSAVIQYGTSANTYVSANSDGNVAIRTNGSTGISGQVLTSLGSGQTQWQNPTSTFDGIIARGAQSYTVTNNNAVPIFGGSMTINSSTSSVNSTSTWTKGLGTGHYDITIVVRVTSPSDFVTFALLHGDTQVADYTVYNGEAGVDHSINFVTSNTSPFNTCQIINTSGVTISGTIRSVSIKRVL